MSVNIHDHIKKYLKSRKERARFLWGMLGMSCCVAVCVYGALSLPALGIHGENITVNSRFLQNPFGTEATVNFEAIAKENQDETVFLIKSIKNDAHLTEETPFVENVSQINLGNDKTLALHKIVPAEPETQPETQPEAQPETQPETPPEAQPETSNDEEFDQYWFALPTNETAKFDLHFASDTATETAAQGSEAQITLYCVCADTLENAQLNLQMLESHPEDDSSVILKWRNLSDVQTYLRQNETFTEQTLNATVFTDSTLSTPASEGSANVKINGIMPEGASVTAFPVDNVSVAGSKMVAAYDITVKYGNSVAFEPFDGNTLSVSFEFPSGVKSSSKEKITVYHFADDSDEPQTVEHTSSRDTKTISFEAPSLSVYGIGLEPLADEELRALASSPTNTTVQIGKTIDYLGDGVENRHTNLTGDDFYRLYLSVTNSLSEDTNVDLVIMVDRSSSMSEADMNSWTETTTNGVTTRTPTTIRRDQAVADLLNDSDTSVSFINKFLEKAGNHLAIGWFAGAPTSGYGYMTNFAEQMVSASAGVAVNWTNDGTTTVTRGSTTGNNDHAIGALSNAGTNYTLGMWKALDLLKSLDSTHDDHAKVIIFLTDGYPTYGVIKGVYDQPGYSNCLFSKGTSSPATYEDYLNRASLRTSPGFTVIGDGTLNVDNLQLVNHLTKSAVDDFTDHFNTIPGQVICHTVNYGEPPTYDYTTDRTAVPGYNPDDVENTAPQAKFGGFPVWKYTGTGTSNQPYILSDTQPSASYVPAYVLRTYDIYTSSEPYTNAPYARDFSNRYVYIHPQTRALTYSSATSVRNYVDAWQQVPRFTDVQPAGAEQAERNGYRVWISSITGEMFNPSNNRNPYPASSYPEIASVAAYEQPFGAILKSMARNGGQLHEAGSAYALITALNISATSVALNTVSVTDPLSAYVDLYEPMPDLLIYRKHIETLEEQLLWSTTRGAPASPDPNNNNMFGTPQPANRVHLRDLLGNLLYDSQNNPVYGDVLRSVTYNPTSKELVFETTPDLALDTKWHYAFSYNVRTTDPAYAEVGAPEYGDYGGYPSIGDPGTDFPRISDPAIPIPNNTSAGRPGFFSNGLATLNYKIGDDVTGTTIFPQPVVQVFPASLHLTKTTLTGSPLNGATFSVYNAAVDSESGEWSIIGGETASPVRTDTSAVWGSVTLAGLRAGNYLLKETDNPAGYILPENPWRLSVTRVPLDDSPDFDGPFWTTSVSLYDSSGAEVATDSNGIYTIVNAGDYTLPSTGGAGVWWFTASGVLIILAGVWIWTLKIKRGTFEG